jgi:hypothetical protein
MDLWKPSILLDLAEFVCILVWVEHGSLAIVPNAVVLEHLAVDPYVLALDRQRSFRRLCVNHEVVVAVGAVLVALVELLGVLPKALFALLTREGHVEALEERVLLLLLMALGAVEPFFACANESEIKALCDPWQGSAICTAW